MNYVIRCARAQVTDTPLYSAPFPTLEEAQGALLNWKRREDWRSLEIWEVSPPGSHPTKKPKRIYREDREKTDA
jgi:hypothetical protein